MKPYLMMLAALFVGVAGAACSHDVANEAGDDAGARTEGPPAPVIQPDASAVSSSAHDASAPPADAAKIDDDDGRHLATGADGGPSPNAIGAPCVRGPTPTTSGIPRNRAVQDFTDADRTVFCKWAATAYGGYGCHSTCSGGLERDFSANLADCKANYTRPGCTATAAELEKCTTTDADDVCQLAIFDAPECAAWTACLRL